MNVPMNRYVDTPILFTEDGWINATYLSKYYGKRLDCYFDNLETHTYIDMLCELYQVDDYRYFIKARRGKNGGTLIHYDLAIHFGYWLLKRKETAFGYNVSIPYLEHLRQQYHSILHPEIITNSPIPPIMNRVNLMANLRSLSELLDEDYNELM